MKLLKIIETPKANVHVIGLQHEPKQSPAKKQRTEDTTVRFPLKLFVLYFSLSNSINFAKYNSNNTIYNCRSILIEKTAFPHNNL